jgi:tetratricopeptide (TPR) repeat protein
VAGYYSGLGACHLLLGHLDEAIDLLRKALTANHRLWFVHLWLAGALGLRGDLAEARAALAEAIKLKPDIDSLTRFAAQSPFTNPEYVALRDAVCRPAPRRLPGRMTISAVGDAI